jgi:hypothetical protein
MKVKFIFIFLLYTASLDLYSQCLIREVDIIGNSKKINIDSIINIPKLTFDSIVLSQIFVPQNLMNIRTCGHCIATVYVTYITFQNKLIETKIIRGIDSKFDSILMQQHRIVFSNIEKYSKFDSSKFYFINIAIRFELDYNEEKKYIEHLDNSGGRLYILQKKQIDVHFIIDSIKPNDIPKNIEECLNQLDTILDNTTKNKIKKWDEEYYKDNVTFIFYQWISNNWNIPCGIISSDTNRYGLVKYFYDLGINEECYIPAIIRDCYYRHLIGEPLAFNEVIEKYKIEQSKNK